VIAHVVVVSVGLLSALARPAASQSDSLLFPGDPQTSAQLAAIVAGARDAGLPTDPILGKVLYGRVVVHAPPQKIIGAARALAARLEISRDALMPGPTPNDIATGADALEYGATKDQLRAIRKACGEQPVSTPLGVLAQLVASRVEPKRAAQIVTDLIKRRASTAQLVALGNDVNADVASGANATAALDIRLRGLTAVLAPAGAAATTDAPGLSATTPKKKP
jgi:hypothetical protein